MRSGSRHRGEAGGGWFGFPPLLATDGRIHKGDCDMRTGANFARGSCRALKWMALFGVVAMLGAGQVAAQEHAVVDGTSATGVNILLPGAVTTAPPESEAPAGAALMEAFTMDGYTVTAVGATPVEGTGTQAGYTIVEVTVNTAITGMPTIKYEKPGLRDGRLQMGGTQDVEDFSHVVRPAQPALPPVEDIDATMGDTVSHELPVVDSGGMLPIVYTAEDAAGDDITGNITAGTGEDERDSGLRFDADARSLVGIARDVGAYTFRYRARSADGGDAGLSQERTVTINVVAVPAAAMTDGTITAITVDGATERTIGGVTRAHVTEGELAKVSVEVEWTHAQVTALWARMDPPEPATVRVMVVAETDAAAWLSLAETDENPGLGELGGDDAVLATNTVSIPIPAKPKPTENPNATNSFRSGKKDVVLSLPKDEDAEDEGFRIHVVAGSGKDISTSAPRGMTMTERLIVIEDVDTQGIVLKRDPPSTAAIFEGAALTFKAEAAPRREDLELQVRYSVTTLEGVSVSSRLYTLDSAIGVIPVGTGAKDQVKFTSPKNDGDREDNEFRIHAEVVSFDLGSGAFDEIEEAYVDFEVLDLHKLPPLAVSPMEGEVMEGESVELTLRIDRNPPTTRRVGSEKVDVTKEALTVMLSMGAGSTASASDYSIMTNPVEIPKHDGKAPWVQEVMVEVMAEPDTDLEGMEMLVLDAEVDGTENAASGPNSADDSYAGVSMLTIEESTAKHVWAKTQDEVEAAIYDAKNDGMGDDEMFTAGEMIEVMGSALFNAAEGVTLRYSAESSDSAVASTMSGDGTVTVTAMGGGDAMVTITAHASMPSSVKINPQTDPGEASITFPVEVGLEALSFMLKGPDDMNIVEGGMAMLTVTANRAVGMDTEVMIMRDRAMSTAMDSDYMPVPTMITIEMGDMMGSVEITATEDNMAEDMEELVLYAMVGDMMVEGHVKLYIWDAAVPALPLIAQLLLGLFLAIGGYRRYLRR